MKKYLVVFLIGVFLTSLFATPGFSKKLVIACWYNLADLGGWKEIVEEFQKKNPGVEIEVQITPWEEFLPKILTQVASGTAPDIITVENQPFPAFAGKGLLRDLTDYMEKTKGFSKKDFFSHYIDRYSVEGRIYGIPWDCEPVACLFYNKKLFKDAGVAYPNNTWRWQQLLESAQKLTKKQGDRVIQYGFNLQQEEWKYFVYTNGGALVDNIKKPTKCMLDSKRAIDGIQFYLDLMYKYQVSPSPAMIEASGASSVDLFLTGKVAMSLGGIWDAFFHPKEYHEIAGLTIAPAGPTGIRKYRTGGTAWTITRASKEPDLAWKFITFFMGLEGFKIQFNGSYKGALDIPAYIPSYKWYISQKDLYLENLDVNGEAAKYAVFDPYDARWPEIQTRHIDPEMDLILRNQKPLAPTIKDIALNVTKALQGK